MNVITNSDEKISMRVFDAQGRLIEEREGLQPMETLRIGERYINGVYMAEIRQGKNSKTDSTYKNVNRSLLPKIEQGCSDKGQPFFI